MKNIFGLFLLMIPSLVFSQPDNSVEMADVMRSNGKIYVVLAVVLVIFAGIIIYMVSIDRKLSKMERENKKK